MWVNTSVDRILAEGPVTLKSVVVLASAAGGDVTLYNGTGSGAGNKIGQFKGAQNVSNPINWPEGLPCENGLYVDVGSNITEVLVSFE